jgi:hypothetical protein
VATKTKQDAIMSRWDAASMAVFMLIGAAFAVWTVVAAVPRIIEVLANQDVRVFAEFAGTMADAPIGPDGAPVAVELDTAYLVAPELPVASVGALVIEQLVIVAAVVTVVTCLLLLTWNVLHGRMFSRTNTRLVATAGIVAFFGVALAPFFGNMGANGAFAWISDRTFDNVILAADFAQLVTVAFIAALAATTFTVGDRLQRDTEGLV